MGRRARLHEPHAPGERQDGGCDAEADDVRERIHLPAKIAGGVGEARDPSVDAVEQHGHADGSGGKRELLGGDLRMLQIQRALNGT